MMNNFFGRVGFQTFPTAIVVSCLAGGSVALSQVQSVSPYYAMVTQDSTNLRCGPSQNFYSVHGLTTGTILVIDGETQGWNRVLYPVGIEAFIDAKDATLQESKVALAKESQLRAINQTQGYAWSWKMLTDAPLATGTSLTLVETIKEGEIVVGYKVVAPPEARGYVPSSRLRRATKSEVDQYWAAGKALPQLPNVTIATSETVPSPIAKNDDSTDSEQASSDGSSLPGSRVTGDSSYQSNTPGAGNPVRTLGAGDVIIPDSMDAAVGDTTAGDTTVGDAETNTIADLSNPSPEQLERTFQRVWREPVESSEVDELIGQYQVAIERVEVNQPRRRAALEQRVEALKVRRDFRDALHRQQAAASTLQQNEQVANQQMDLAAAARVYNIVGVLQPSTVYNGDRLPLMYRVVSVGGTSPRTLGYIRKGSELDLDRYLGQIVGVVGENALDRSLQLNLITPVRIDPLRSVATPATKQPATQPTAKPEVEPVAPAPSGESAVPRPAIAPR